MCIGVIEQLGVDICMEGVGDFEGVGDCVWDVDLRMTQDICEGVSSTCARARIVTTSNLEIVGSEPKGASAENHLQVSLIGAFGGQWHPVRSLLFIRTHAVRYWAVSHATVGLDKAQVGWEFGMHFLATLRQLPFVFGGVGDDVDGGFDKQHVIRMRLE